MCLESGIRKPNKDEIIGVGYKVFRGKDGSDLIGAFIGSKPVPVRKWVNEKGHRSSVELKPSEGFGWHIFLSKDDALSYYLIGDHVVRKVRYRAAARVGRTWARHERETIVAKEIYIYKTDIK